MGIQVDSKELQQVFVYFLFNQDMPRPDNRSCRSGLRLALASKQKTERVNIEWYFTMHENYVNTCDITHLGNSIFFLSPYPH